MFKDNFKPQAIGKKKVRKLEGHVKLSLYNAENGELEKVIEGENIVTNAISDLCDSCNYFGSVDFTQLTPIYQKLFGGALLLKNQFPVEEDKIPRDDDYFIKGDNPVIAHAGDEVPTDFGDDPSRGMPNTTLQVKKPNSITLSWTWTTTQGNGEIAAVALTHKDTGNAGTGSASNAFAAFDPYQQINRTSLNVSNGVNSQVFGMLDDKTGFNFSYSGSDTYIFTFNFISLAMHAAGLKDTKESYNVYSSILSTIYFRKQWAPSYSFDEDTKTLWLFSNCYNYAPYNNRYHKDQITYMKVSFKYDTDHDRWTIDTDTIDGGTITLDIADLSPINKTMGVIPHQKKKIEGGLQDVFYFPIGTDYWGDSEDYVLNSYGSGAVDISGLRRLNFQNQADTTKITLNNHCSFVRSGMCGRYDGDLIEFDGRMLKGTVGYNCVNHFPINTESHAIIGSTRADFPQMNKIASYVDTNGDPYRWIVINKMFYSTKFNLKETVNKTSANTMVLEYTLREVFDYDES